MLNQLLFVLNKVQLLWSITHNFMPIGCSLLNLLSFCRVIRHKIEFMPMPFGNFLPLVLNQLSSGSKWVPVEARWWNWWLRTSVASQWKIRRDIVHRSIRQGNAKRKYFESSFFPGYCFSVQFDAPHPRTQDQFWAENCQTWCLDPDFLSLLNYKLQPTLGIWWRPKKPKKIGIKNLCGSPAFKARLQTATNLYSSSSSTWSQYWVPA